MNADTPPCRVVITPRDEKLAAQDSVRQWCEQVSRLVEKRTARMWSGHVVPRRLRKKGWL